MAGNDEKVTVTFAIIVTGYAITQHVVFYVLLRNRGNRGIRSVWVRKWLQRRKEYGVGNTLLRELRKEYALNYKKI